MGFIINVKGLSLGQLNFFRRSGMLMSSFQIASALQFGTCIPDHDTEGI